MKMGLVNRHEELKTFMSRRPVGPGGRVKLIQTTALKGRLVCRPFHMAPHDTLALDISGLDVEPVPDLFHLSM